ncbi:hypothetical protein SAMN04488523_1019 [Sulfitobacter brevis]|uniref:Invasion protein IalB, involved in pathogenesis n=1 Tax=Sulfitobacter brevis TaxID=74348 RepID=A0A1I1SF72_9RHOB|nr:hypothetical protein [Sulfitobacter brevis]SFD44982.1 hypothetical protein SAMN04488523_1019 [Sulfitobacter brevis]
MKIEDLATTCLLICVGFGAPALAQSLEEWGASEYWDVMIDPTLGDGCLIQSEFDDGSVVRIGFDRTEGTGYVTAFNMSWGDIVEGQLYPVLFSLDGEDYEADATGIYLDDVPGADIAFDSTDFLFDIARKYTMTLYTEEGEVMSIDLTGSYQALEAAIECQDEQG